ncbi:MAG: tetratricopeptide repeat-containing sensor histidine kinase [Salinivirgaceae bacterium]|jgi:signal transduction histidine kinase|nr:tetratricopeptide repeat-containing sensor histidine kinase [Salinivirgaceae bacterium]
MRIKIITPIILIWLPFLSYAATTDKSDKTATAKVYSVADSLYTAGNNSVALDTLLTVLPTFNSINNDTLESKILGLFSHLQKNIGNDTLGLRSFLSRLNKKQMERYLITVDELGQYFYAKQNYPKALSYFKKTILFAQNTNNNKAEANALFQIGMVFKEQYNTAKSKEYLQKTLSIYEAEKMTDGIIKTCNELGRAALLENNTELAMSYFNRAIALAKETGSAKSKLIAYHSLSELMQKKGSMQEANTYLKKALSLAEKHYKAKFPVLYLDLAKLSEKEHKTAQAIEYYKNSIAKAEQQANQQILIEALERLGAVYQEQQKYQLSASCYSRANHEAQLLQEKMSSEETARYKARYSLMQKEQEIELLDRDRKLRNAKLHNEQLRSAIYLFSLVLLALLVIVLSYHIITHIKKNKLLSYQNVKINEQNEELNQINQQLSQSENKLMHALATKNKLFAIIGHDLKSPLLDIKNLLFVLKENPQQLSPEQIKKHSMKIENQLSNLLELLNNLLNWGMAERNTIGYNPEMVDIASVVEKTTTLFDGQLQTKKIDIKKITPQNQKWYTDYNMVEFVLRNLISNAIKFSHHGGVIYLAIAEDLNSLIISVEDFGIGMNEKQKDNLFIQTTGKIRRGTDNEKGTGLGMALTYDFVRQMNGTIYIESEPEKGTKIVVTLEKQSFKPPVK